METSATLSSKQSNPGRPEVAVIEEQFQHDEEFFQRYKETINDYITKGYTRRVADEELNPIGKPLWYLPHHASFPSHKPDKLRVVFDCATKFRGTSLTNNLFGFLDRFWQESIAFVLDIEAMFHQVRVDPRHYDSLHFLWWPDDDVRQQPVGYRMVHLFGSTSSPSVTSFSSRKKYYQQDQRFPNARYRSRFN